MVNNTISRGCFIIYNYSIKVCRQLASTAILALLLTLSGYAGSSTTSFSALPADLNWQLDKTVSGVDFFYAKSSCDGHDVVFLKMKNKNTYSVEVTWKEVFQTQLARDKEGFSGAKKIVLPPGETLESDCAHPANPALLILSSQVDPTYVVTISKFSYKDISVIKVK